MKNVDYGKLLPAYGRDYKTAKGATASLLAGKDWIISSMFHPNCLKPINLEQIQQDGVGKVALRYDRRSKVCFVAIPKAKLKTDTLLAPGSRQPASASNESQRLDQLAERLDRGFTSLLTSKQ